MSRHAASAFHEVESSPDGRYVRFDEQLGSGAYKVVYLAYDTETGKEVAWNAVQMKRLPVAEKRRIRMETSILSRLHHPHIINFYHHWCDEAEEQINFTTEIVTSGTLKHYTQRLKHVKVKVIKKWYCLTPSPTAQHTAPHLIPHHLHLLLAHTPSFPPPPPPSPLPCAGVGRSCLRWCICTATRLPSSTATSSATTSSSTALRVKCA